MPKPFTDSTSIAGDGKALAERMASDGYLFVRDLLPRADVLAVRDQFRALAAKAGWLHADGTANSERACKDPEPRYLEHFKAMWKLEDLHRLKHHRNLVGLFERMFGEPVLVHPLLVARNIFPASNGFDFTTGRHQDRIHIGGGTSYAAWVSLGDCPIAKGGLTIAPGSHRAGVLPFRIAAGAGGLETERDYEGEWVASDFRAGDVVIFSDTTVHKALPNRSGELRQSFDARYQRLSDPVAEVSIRTYANMFDWSEVYAGWKGSEELRYYWIRQGARIVPFDTQYYERRDAIAFELAERGDLLARDTLLRVVQRDADTTKRARAAALLDRLDKAYGGAARVA